MKMKKKIPKEVHCPEEVFFFTRLYVIYLEEKKRIISYLDSLNLETENM